MSHVREHWVCFACRKQFRKPAYFMRVASWSLPYQTSRWELRKRHEALEYACPECKAALVNMGKYFKPPRREDIREWESLRLLGEHGIRFSTEGSVAFLRMLVGSRPNRKAYEQMIACCPCHTHTEGQRLLLKIARKPRK